MKRIKKGLWMGLIFVFGACGSSARGQEKSSTIIQNDQDRPNIVFILADDMGFSDLGATGSEIQTPNLDRLADNGMLFTDMHNTSKCFPSRAQLLTGQYAQSVDMARYPGHFHHGVMFGQVLKNAGYRTLFIGKHHGTDNPYYWGFDHYWGLRDGAANYFNPGQQRTSDPGPPAQKMGHYPRNFAFDGKILTPFTPSKDYYSTDTWTDWAIGLLKRYKDEDKPVCLYLAYQAPHDPLQAPKETIKKYKGIYDKGYKAIRQARYRRQREMGVLDGRYPLSKPTHRQWNALSDSAQADQARRMQVYAAMIDRLDQNIGRIIAQLKKEGKFKNTLFMFASDNGASAEVVKIGHGRIGSMIRWASLKKDWANVANTPFRYYKNDSYEGGIVTPFIVHWPKGIPKGGKIDHTTLDFVDLMPTLIDITGAHYPNCYKGEKVGPLVGTSMLPLFKGQSIERKNPLYFHYDNGSAILTSGWKLVKKRKKWELYNMQTDRTETNNVAGEVPKVFRELRLKWRNWAKEVGILK